MEILIVVLILVQFLNAKQDLKTWSVLVKNMETTTRLLGKMIDRINTLEDRDGEEWKY